MEAKIQTNFGGMTSLSPEPKFPVETPGGNETIDFEKLNELLSFLKASEPILFTNEDAVGQEPTSVDISSGVCEVDAGQDLAVQDAVPDVFGDDREHFAIFSEIRPISKNSCSSISHSPTENDNKECSSPHIFRREELKFSLSENNHEFCGKYENDSDFPLYHSNLYREMPILNLSNKKDLVRDSALDLSALDLSALDLSVLDPVPDQELGKKRKRSEVGIQNREVQNIRETPTKQYYNDRHFTAGGSIRRTSYSKYDWIRKYNNWVKRCLIIDAINRSKKESHDEKKLTFVDFGCGVGGDLQKYSGLGVEMYVGLDISEVCIRNAKERYEELARNDKIDYRGFFFDCDLSQTLADDLYPPRPADVVSCMFAMHYFFEHESGLHKFLSNVSSILRPGGIFVGIVPDAAVIIRRIRRRTRKDVVIGNGLYTIKPKLSSPLLKNSQILGTGIRYSITLAANGRDGPDVLFDNCDEFLVPRPVLEAIASRYDLRLILWDNLQSFYYNRQHDEYYRSLMTEMNVIPRGPEPKSVRGPKGKKNITFDEWELLHLYSTFMFEKK